MLLQKGEELGKNNHERRAVKEHKRPETNNKPKAVD